MGILFPSLLADPGSVLCLSQAGLKNPTPAFREPAEEMGLSPGAGLGHPLASPTALRPPGVPKLEGTTKVPFFCLPPLLPAALLKVDFELFIEETK